MTTQYFQGVQTVSVQQPLEVTVSNPPSGSYDVNVVGTTVTQPVEQVIGDDFDVVITNPSPLNVNVTNAPLNVAIADRISALVDRETVSPIQIALGNRAGFTNNRATMRTDALGSSFCTLVPDGSQIVLPLIPDAGIILAFSSTSQLSAGAQLIVSYFATSTSTTYDTMTVQLDGTDGRTKVNTGVSVYRIRDILVNPGTLVQLTEQAEVFFYDNSQSVGASGVPVGGYYDYLYEEDNIRRTGILYCPPGQFCSVRTLHVNSDINSTADVAEILIVASMAGSNVEYRDRFFVSGNGFEYTGLNSIGLPGQTFHYQARRANGTGFNNVVLSVEVVWYDPAAI